MSKNKKAGQRATRQPIPTKIIVESHYAGTEKMETVFKRIAGEQKRKRNNVIDKTFYCCTKYRKFGKEGCSSHTIEARTVHEVVLADIQKHAGQALTDRKAMVTEIAERLNLQLSNRAGPHVLR